MKSKYRKQSQKKQKTSLVKQRKLENAICPVCGSPDYVYDGRPTLKEYSQEALKKGVSNAKHQYHCNQCENIWQYASDN